MNQEQLNVESDLAKSVEQGIKDMSAFYKAGTITKDQVETQLGFMRNHLAELKAQNDPSTERLQSFIKAEFPELTEDF